MNSKVLALFLSIFFIACQQQEPSVSFEQQHQAFCQAIQQQTSIKEFFWKQGALFTNQGLYKHRDSIQVHFQSFDIDTFISTALLQHDSSHWFELGYYKKNNHSDSGLIASAIAWKQVNQQWFKELEIITPKSNQSNTAITAITTARRQWEQYSNQHQVASFIATCYADSSFYFNDGYIYENSAAIEEKYQFMNDPQWRIRLSNHAILQANDSLCYDIGQYISNGKGHYLWCWQRKDNEWKLLLDFNF